MDYTLRNYLILILISFCTSILSRNRFLNFAKLFVLIFFFFLCFCKALNNSTDSKWKYCSKFEFYSSESIKLQENLNNVNRNTTLTYFAISKLRNKPEYFLNFYQILLLFLTLAKRSTIMAKYGNLIKLQVSIFVI